jgi:hypothetical protein
MTTPTNPRAGPGRRPGGPRTHLMLVAEVDPLSEPALAPAPEVQAPAEQVLGVQAVLDHRRGRPLRGDHGVVVQVPPAVIAEVLLAPLLLPGSDDLEAVVVELGDPAGAVMAVGPAQVEQEAPPGPQWTVGAVRSRPFASSSAVISWTSVGCPDPPGVQDRGPGGPQAGDEQVAALQGLPVVALAGWHRALEQAFQPKWWSSLPAVGSSLQPTTCPKLAEDGWQSITAMASLAWPAGS